MLEFKNERFVYTRAQFLRILQRLMTHVGPQKMGFRVHESSTFEKLKRSHESTGVAAGNLGPGP